MVLESEGRKYKLDHTNWPAGHSEVEVQNALCQSSSGKLWLEPGEDTFVRGIETRTFSVDPSVGAAWEAANRKALLWLAVGFFALSAVLIVAVSISKSCA